MAYLRLTSSTYRVGPTAPVESDGVTPSSLIPAQLAKVVGTLGAGAASGSAADLARASALAFPASRTAGSFASGPGTAGSDPSDATVTAARLMAPMATTTMSESAYLLTFCLPFGRPGSTQTHHPTASASLRQSVTWGTVPYCRRMSGPGTRRGSLSKSIVSRAPRSLLKSLRWEGEAAFRVLSYYFTLRWNWAWGADYVRRLLEGFEVAPDPTEELDPPTPNVPPVYSLVDLGPGQEERYRLLYGDHQLKTGEIPREPILHLLWHVNVEALRRTGHFFMIHAGAVVTPSGEGVLIPGPARSGKTTLVAALVRAGFGYLSDEGGAIDPVTRRLYPYPRALTLKAGAFPHFADVWPDDRRPLAATEWHVHPELLRPGALSGPCEVGFVIVATYREGAATELTPISPAAAAAELAYNAINLPLYGPRALPILADVAMKARPYRLVAGDLREAVRAVVEATAPPAARGVRRRSD
jgi:hypothetical protein